MKSATIKSEVPGVGTIEAGEVTEEQLDAALVRADARSCQGCGATSADYRLVPGGATQLGYPGGKFSGDMLDWVIESCPLCNPKGAA